MSESNKTESNSGHKKGQLHPDRIESEILANERTFLAWVRTSIAVMSLGFIISRFSLWMREMCSGLSPAIHLCYSSIFDFLRGGIIGIGRVSKVRTLWVWH